MEEKKKFLHNEAWRNDKAKRKSWSDLKTKVWKLNIESYKNNGDSVQTKLEEMDGKNNNECKAVLRRRDD